MNSETRMSSFISFLNDVILNKLTYRPMYLYINKDVICQQQFTLTKYLHTLMKVSLTWLKCL